MISILDVISILLALLAAVYARQILAFRRGLSRLPAGTSEFHPTVSILVPARNEEQRIRECLDSLLRQDYPSEAIEIVVIDDQSEDGTAGIVRDTTQKDPRVKLLTVASRPPTVSPKINALTTGIEGSHGEIIFTTDADCTADRRWVSAIVRHFGADVGVVTGTTLFGREEAVPVSLYGIQFLDFLSHTACAAGAIGNGRVNNCNGSNMAFRRSAYAAAGGYQSLAHLNSGDDSLLAQLIERTTAWKVRFASDPSATVTTAPVSTWKEFFHQRMRWAAQTSHYHPATVAFLASSFAFYVLLFFLLPFSLLQIALLPVPLLAFLLKLGVDYAILRRFTSMTGTESILRFFLAAELVHVPAILAAVVGGYFGRFEWKGRTLKRELPAKA